MAEVQKSIQKVIGTDRITYSYGAKIGQPNYSSVDFHVGYTSDIKKGETPDEAFERVKAFVDEKAESELSEIAKG